MATTISMKRHQGTRRPFIKFELDLFRACVFGAVVSWHVELVIHERDDSAVLWGQGDLRALCVWEMQS